MFYTLKTILGCFKKDFYNFIQFFSILTDFGNRKGSTSFTLNKTYKFIIIKKFIENYVNHPWVNWFHILLMFFCLLL